MLTKPSASMIRSLQTGDGATTRTAQSKLREFTSPQDFGAVGDGVADDAPAIQLAIAKALDDGFCGITVSAGIYRLASTVTVAMTGLTGFSIAGAGTDLTEFRVDSSVGNGFSFSSQAGNWWLSAAPHNPLVLRDFTLTTTKTNVGTGISFNMGSLEGRPAPGVVMRDITIRGHNSFAHYFATGLEFLDTTGVRGDNIKIIQGGPAVVNGIGIDIHASSAASDPTDIKFTNCEIVFGNIGLRSSDHVEGIYWTQCDVVNAQIGIQWSAGAESGIHVIGGHMNCFERCFDLNGIFDGTINGCLMYSAGGSGTWRAIKCLNGGSMTLVNNVIRAGSATGEIGIEIDSVPNEGLHGYVVSGNHLSNLDSAIVLGANARKVLVGRNQYLNCANRVQNLASSANNNYVEEIEYADSVVVTMAGGSASEIINIPIPAGRFLSKPRAVMAASSTQDLVVFYDFDSGSSTATNARCNVRKADGTSIGAGPSRFSVIMKGL